MLRLPKILVAAFAFFFFVSISGSRLAADPITDANFFSVIPHTHITFEADGTGTVYPVLPNLTRPAAEYAGDGLTILPEIRVVRDTDSCFRTVQDIAGGSTPYGLLASNTQALVFNPPVNAVGFVFVAIFFQNATFTARDVNGAILETAVMGAPFTDGFGCGFLEYGFVGISSTTPIARLDIAAPSGVIDNLRFSAASDSDGDGIADDEDNCPAIANADQANADGDALGDACDSCPNDPANDADGDGICGDIDNCPDDANADQANLDGDAFGDACDDDIDGDGLLNSAEATIGTNPALPDTDGDGLLDGTEVDIAAGSGCPNPLVVDSDGDGLTDGNEVLVRGTSPCNADSDGDGIGDGDDPLPLQPGVTSGFMEAIVRQLASSILSIDLAEFDAPNSNARKARRNVLSHHAAEAANQIALGNYDSAAEHLATLLKKVDGQPQPPDWMLPSATTGELAELTALYLMLLEYF